MFMYERSYFTNMTIMKLRVYFTQGPILKLEQ